MNSPWTSPRLVALASARHSEGAKGRDDWESTTAYNAYGPS